MSLHLRLAGPLALTLMSSLGGGCALEKRLERLEQRQQELSNKLAETEIVLTRVQHFYEFEVRRIWAKISCQDVRVRDFIHECEQSPDSPNCSEGALANALVFMNSQPYVSLYMRPGDKSKNISSVRHGQFTLLLDLRELHPSTRLLILVQPRGESLELQREAMQLGREVYKYLREEVGLPGWVQLLGPRTLPCQLKQHQLRSYTRRLDVIQPGEPTEKEPHIRIWAFRTDC